MLTVMPTPEQEWAEILKPYRPLLTPEECEAASGGIITASMIRHRNGGDRGRLPLSFRRVGNKSYVTKESLHRFLCGKEERPL